MSTSEPTLPIPALIVQGLVNRNSRGRWAASDIARPSRAPTRLAGSYSTSSTTRQRTRPALLNHGQKLLLRSETPTTRRSRTETPARAAPTSRPRSSRISLARATPRTRSQMGNLHSFILALWPSASSRRPPSRMGILHRTSDGGRIAAPTDRLFGASSEPHRLRGWRFWRFGTEGAMTVVNGSRQGVIGRGKFSPVRCSGGRSVHEWRTTRHCDL